MTKKHYIAIAKAIHMNSMEGRTEKMPFTEVMNKEGFINDFIALTIADNPLFNVSKFKEACK